MKLEKIRQAIVKKPYLYYFIFITLAYLAINVILSQFYITLRYIPRYLATLNWTFFLSSVILSVIIAVLIAININLIIMNYKENKRLNVKLTPIGFIFGLSAGICPLCITGLFPFLFSLFGFSLSILPFQGIELQILSILILLISINFLLKENKLCKT